MKRLAFALAGATLADPARVEVRGAVTTGRDVEIDIDVILEGLVELGDDVRIGPNCVLRDAAIGAGIASDATVVARELVPLRLVTVETAPLPGAKRRGSKTGLHPVPPRADEITLNMPRLVRPETTGEAYTWWSNRGQAWAKNVGWRIDYQIVSPDLKDKISSASVYKSQRFSDHSPLIIDYTL